MPRKKPTKKPDEKVTSFRPAPSPRTLTFELKGKLTVHPDGTRELYDDVEKENRGPGEVVDFGIDNEGDA